MSDVQSATWTPSGLSQQDVTEIVRERQAALKRVAELEAKLAAALDALRCQPPSPSGHQYQAPTQTFGATGSISRSRS